MCKKETIFAIALSVAALSIQGPAHAGVNPKTFESKLIQTNINVLMFDIETSSVKNTASSSGAKSVLVAWSLKGAYNKTKGAVKGAGRAVGRGVRKVNRVIVPREIRQGSSYVYGKVKRGAKYVYKHPYGKRCKPNKYLQPVCTVGPKKPRERSNQRVRVQDHRQVRVHDHRRVRVHDHRQRRIQVRRR